LLSDLENRVNEKFRVVDRDIHMMERYDLGFRVDPSPRVRAMQVGIRRIRRPLDAHLVDAPGNHLVKVWRYS